MFLERWHELLPDELERDGRKPGLEALAGLVVKCPPPDEAARGSGGCVRLLDSGKLPPDAKALFKALFEAKARWQLDELRPFVGPLCTSTGKTEAALL